LPKFFGENIQKIITSVPGLPHFPLGGLFPAMPAGLPSLAAIKVAAGSTMDSNRNLLSPIFPGFPFPGAASPANNSGDASPPSMSDLVSIFLIFFVTLSFSHLQAIM
jgi:hypothetical protein